MANPAWVQEAISLYTKDKKTYKQIGEIVGANRKTVSYYLRLNGVQSNQAKVRKINPEKLRKYDYTVCEKCFETIDTEEKAYWLGFLYADGCVNSSKSEIELSLQELDIEHLKKFRTFLGLDDKPFLKKEKVINGQIKVSYKFSFSSEKVKEDLIKLGCGPQKTFNLTFPNFIEEHLLNHFIRGYIDGDGCIYTRKKLISLEILGTEEFLKGYQEWANEGNSKIYSINHSSIKRVINANNQALRILQRIYTNATIFLERKYYKYTNHCRLISTTTEEIRS